MTENKMLSERLDEEAIKNFTIETQMLGTMMNNLHELGYEAINLKLLIDLLGDAYDQAGALPE
jgi:hypothetical protein